MTDYNAIFNKFEQSLFSYSTLPEQELRRWFSHFRIDSSTTFTDEEYYQKIVAVIFYAGIRTTIVSERWPIISGYFRDIETVSSYNDDDILQMLHDPKMLKSKWKINAAVNNARIFKKLINSHGSIEKYFATFQPHESFENVMSLKRALHRRFAGLGQITTYHFMTDIGLPVLKPDRVVTRIFQRLGLIYSDQQLFETVLEGRKFAEATGLPIRYIDIIFVTYGQASNPDLGMATGICLKKNPLCGSCGATEYCNYYQKRRLEA